MSTAHTPGQESAHLTLRPTTPADRPVLERLWQLFRHDMSEVSGALPDPSGQFRSERLDALFTDPGRRGLIAHLEPADGTPASPVGFSLVRDVDERTRVLTAFFVVRGARRAGIGRQLAAQTLASFPGRWEIAFQDANPPAVRFWREVATTAVGQEWDEEHRAVPGRPDVPPDTWISFTTA